MKTRSAAARLFSAFLGLSLIFPQSVLADSTALRLSGRIVPLSALIPASSLPASALLSLPAAASLGLPSAALPAAAGLPAACERALTGRTAGPERPASLAGDTAGRQPGAPGLDGSIGSPRDTAAEQRAETAEPPAAVEQARGLAETAVGSPAAAPAEAATSLGEAFDGTRPAPMAGEAPPEAAPQAAGAPGLGAPASRGSLWSSWFGVPPAPRSSLKRSIRAGLVTAFASVAFTQAATATAAALGWQFHSNYRAIGHGVPTLAMALLFSVIATTIAPIAEEPVFRWALQGGLAAALKRGAGGLSERAVFWLSALPTAAVFVAVHETADPVLIGVRLVTALAFGYTFKKEGLWASMAAHAFFNGLISVPLVFMAALGQTGGTLASFAVWAAAGVATVAAWKKLRAEKPEVDSGAVVPHPLKSSTAVLLALLLVGAFFFLMPNWYWLAGAAALMVYARLKR